MKKILLRSSLLLAILIVLLLFSGPYFVKNYLVENSKELVGRQVQLNRLHFNPLNGHLLVTEFKLLELDDQEFLWPSTPFL